MKDNRHSNYHKITPAVKKQLEDLKRKDRWRSARNIGDRLGLKVHKRTIEIVFKSEYFGGVTRASRYHPSNNKITHLELQHALTILERRTVTRFNTISLYGIRYRIPAGYMKCRIWIKIVGNKLYFESMGKIFWKTRLMMK